MGGLAVVVDVFFAVISESSIILAQLRISKLSGFLTMAVEITKPTNRIPRVIKLIGSIKPRCFFMADSISILEFLAIDKELLVNRK